MYDKNDKRRLYQLMDMYLTKFITAPIFCDEFYYSYDLEIDFDTLTKLEHETFSELSAISSRFSQFEDDLKNYPEVYYSEDELRKKIIETKEKLKDEFNDFYNQLQKNNFA